MLSFSLKEIPGKDGTFPPLKPLVQASFSATLQPQAFVIHDTKEIWLMAAVWLPWHVISTNDK